MESMILKDDVLDTRISIVNHLFVYSIGILFLKYASDPKMGLMRIKDAVYYI